MATIAPTPSPITPDLGGRPVPPEQSAPLAAPVADDFAFATQSPAGTAAESPAGTAPQVLPARMGTDWLSWSITSLVLTAFFILIVSGRVVTEGPVLVVLSATHGIHEGDLFALSAACGGIALPLLRGFRRR